MLDIFVAFVFLRLNFFNVQSVVEIMNLWKTWNLWKMTMFGIFRICGKLMFLKPKGFFIVV